MQNNNSIMDDVTPMQFHLSQNYPNPFSEKTTIKYCVAYKTRVQITVYNSEGVEVEKLVDEEKNPGTYEVEFSACHSRESLPDGKAGGNPLNGYYYYKMIAGDFTSEKKWLCINKLSGRLNMKSFLQSLFVLLLVTQICFGQWYQQNCGTNKNIYAVQFIDVNNGFAVGDSGIIIHTTNGGEEWLIQTSGTINRLNGLQFIDSNLGFAVGDTGAVLRTNDGGISWAQEPINTNFNLKDIYFIDENNGWIVGGVGHVWPPDTVIVLHTTNGGINWIQQTCNAPWQLNGVYFINENIGWVVGGGCCGFFADSANVFYTSDGGLNWIPQLNVEKPGLNDVHFVDENIGWAVGGARGLDMGVGGIIINTIDGGANWTIILESDSRAFNDISFLDQNLGFIVGSVGFFGPGLILRTQDGGLNWMEEIFGSIGVLRSISFIDLNNGWVAGDNGIILHTTNGGVSFVEEEEIDELPTEFLLSQNYPNPFNPSTSIQYALSSRQFVKLTIYDLLGREIETLVTEEKLAGTYEVTWYAEQLPSGVYFYQLMAGSYIETKKMLLLK